MPTSGYTGNVIHEGKMQSFLKSNLELPSGDYDKKVSAIIHLLVLEKYKNILKNLRDRRLKRLENSSIFPNFYNETSQQSPRQCNGAVTEFDDFRIDSSIRTNSPGVKSSLRGMSNLQMNYTMSDNDYSLDSGNYTSLESFGSRTGNEQEPTVDHHEEQILPIAVEEEETDSPRLTHYYSIPAEYTFGKSIGSSNISTLVSAIENRKSVYSHYSPVIKTKNQRRQNLISKPCFSYESNENDYESLTNWRMSEREEMLIQQHDIQQEIIRQVCKALTVARKTQKLFGWEMIAETERLLCVASYRKDTIANLLTQTMTEESNNNNVTTTIRISNMRFFSSDSHINPKDYKKSKQFFMCILHCESTILESELVVLRGNEILFEENFQFEDISPEFEITINLFRIKEMPKKVKKINFFGRKNESSPIIGPTQSSFISWGKTVVKPAALQESPPILSLSNIPVEANISSSFTAEIQLS